MRTQVPVGRLELLEFLRLQKGLVLPVRQALLAPLGQPMWLAQLVRVLPVSPAPLVQRAQLVRALGLHQVAVALVVYHLQVAHCLDWSHLDPSIYS